MGQSIKFLEQEVPVEKWPNSLYMISDIPSNTQDMSAAQLIATAVLNARYRNEKNALENTPKGTGKHHSNQYYTGTLSEVKPHIEQQLKRFDKIFNEDVTKKYVMLVFKVPNDLTIKTDKVYGQRIKSVNPEVLQAKYVSQIYYLED